MARTDVLLLDDWGLAALDGSTRADLMEVIDDRAGTRPTIVTSQLPVEHWHAWIGDATIADAILDRLLSRSQRITLRGESMRPGKVTGVDIKKALELQTEIDDSEPATRRTALKPSKTE